MPKDFFISYTSADKKWAEWIDFRLRKAGYSTVVQCYDFRPGSNFALEMQRALSDSDRVIAVLSPEYLGAWFTLPEWAAAFVQDPAGTKRKLIPVRVKVCDLKGLLSGIIYIDLVGVKPDEARRMLLDGVKQEISRPKRAPRFPGIARESSHVRIEEHYECPDRCPWYEAARVLTYMRNMEASEVPFYVDAPGQIKRVEENHFRSVDSIVTALQGDFGQVLLLEGNAGSGKSTCLRQLVATIAKQQIDNLRFGFAHRIPVYLTLGEQISDELDQDILSHVAACGWKGLAQFSAEGVFAHKEIEWVICLDGFDETVNKSKNIKIIYNFIKKYIYKGYKVALIISSRPFVFPQNWHNYYPIIRLGSWGDDEIRKYAIGCLPALADDFLSWLRESQLTDTAKQAIWIKSFLEYWESAKRVESLEHVVDFAGTLLPMHALEHALRVLSDHEQGKGVMFRRRIYGPLQKLAYIIDGQESCPLDDAESLVGPKRLVELQTMSLIQIYNEQVMFVDNKQKIFFATKEIKKRFGKKVLDITIEDLPQWSLEFYYSCMETVKQIF